VPPDKVSFEVALTQINQSNLHSSRSVSNRGRDVPYYERHLRELACKDRLRWEIGDCRTVYDRMEDVIPGSCAKHWTNELIQARRSLKGCMAYNADVVAASCAIANALTLAFLRQESC
jgi:hypothetical protein